MKEIEIYLKNLQIFKKLTIYLKFKKKVKLKSFLNNYLIILKLIFLIMSVVIFMDTLNHKVIIKLVVLNKINFIFGWIGLNVNFIGITDFYASLFYAHF